MKRILTSVVVILLMAAFCVTPAFAQQGCAKSCTKTCAAPCPTMKAEEAKANSEAKVAKDCANIVLAIEGMTCAGCENSISKALGEVKGVLAVESISHKDGKAVVCVVPDTDAEMIAGAVTKLGYKAEVKEVGKVKACTHDENNKCVLKTAEAETK
ncbi:MAG: cation transporter [Candidatus Zixiibacteriota bacterium]